mmetsp:Transcript_14413/g.42892  ORF Transcript_14413/g.42892 Transcript_14413/m.42892 type:complete len:293 (+) Transcript_14413:241-1119(+)
MRLLQVAVWLPTRHDVAQPASSFGSCAALSLIDTCPTSWSLRVSSSPSGASSPSPTSAAASVSGSHNTLYFWQHQSFLSADQYLLMLSSAWQSCGSAGGAGAPAASRPSWPVSAACLPTLLVHPMPSFLQHHSLFPRVHVDTSVWSCSTALAICSEGTIAAVYSCWVREPSPSTSESRSIANVFAWYADQAPMSSARLTRPSSLLSVWDHSFITAAASRAAWFAAHEYVVSLPLAGKARAPAPARNWPSMSFVTGEFGRKTHTAAAPMMLKMPMHRAPRQQQPPRQLRRRAP